MCKISISASGTIPHEDVSHELCEELKKEIQKLVPNAVVTVNLNVNMPNEVE